MQGLDIGKSKCRTDSLCSYQTSLAFLAAEVCLVRGSILAIIRGCKTCSYFISYFSIFFGGSICIIHDSFKVCSSPLFWTALLTNSHLHSLFNVSVLGWKDGRPMKSTCCSCRGLRFSFQYPHTTRNNLWHQFQGTWCLLTSSGTRHTCGAHTNMQAKHPYIK